MTGPMIRLRAYLDNEDPKPAAALFALNAVDELDTATFVWLGPAIARTFDKGVGDVRHHRHPGAGGSAAGGDPGLGGG